MVHVKRTRFMDTLPVKQPEQTSFIGSLAALRLSGDLCDCVLVSADGAEFQAHRVVLAAASLFFRALYAGSGQQMLDSSTTNVHGQYRIQICNITGQGLELALSAMYQQELQARIRSCCHCTSTPRASCLYNCILCCTVAVRTERGTTAGRCSLSPD